MKGKNINLQEIIDKEETYTYKLVLNAKKPIEKLFLTKLNEIISTRNLSVKDAILDIFASNCVYVEDNVFDTFSVQAKKTVDNSVDNKNVDKIGVENNKTGNTSHSTSTSIDSFGIVQVDPDVTQEMKAVITNMFGN
jgi:hypothetical protein